MLYLIKDRGEQSVGIMSTDKKHKEIGDVNNLILKTSWEDFSDSGILLAHNRRPSAGMNRTIDATQPIEFNNINLIHNGTVKNAKEIAKDINIEFETSDTDSVVLAKILNNKSNFNALNNITGTATLIWFYNNEPDRVYFVKTKLHDESRPLYLMNTKEGLYFSSEESALDLCSNNSEESASIKNIVHNTVFSYGSDRKLKTELKLNLEEEKPKTKSFHQTNTTSNYSSNRDSFNSQYNDLKLMEYYSKVYDAKSKSSIININNYDISQEKVNASFLPINQLVYYRGRYWIGGGLANGRYTFNTNYILDSKGKAFFFVKGFKINNETDYFKSRFRLGSLSFGSYEFYNNIKELTSQPIPIEKSSGIVRFSMYKDGVDHENFIYSPVGGNNLNYEFMSGYMITSSKFLLSKMNIGDIVNVKTEPDDIIIEDINNKLGKFTGINQFGEYATYDEYEIINHTRIEDYKVVNTDTSEEDTEEDKEYLLELYNEMLEFAENNIDELSAIFHVDGAMKLQNITEKFLKELKELGSEG